MIEPKKILLKLLRTLAERMGPVKFKELDISIEDYKKAKKYFDIKYPISNPFAYKSHKKGGGDINNPDDEDTFEIKKGEELEKSLIFLEQLERERRDEKRDELSEELKDMQKENVSIQRQQKDISKSNRNINFSNVGVMVSLVIITVVLGTLNYCLLEETSVPNKAVLEIKAIRTRGEPSPKFSLNDIMNDNVEIQLFLANTGRIPTSTVNLLRWNDSWISIDSLNKIDSYYTHIQNIKSGDTFTSTIPIIWDKKSEIPLGKTKIHISYDCDFCESFLDEKEIEICIYEENYNNCKK